MTDYGYQVEIPVSYDEAVLRTRLALRAEGFSILTEMHVGGMLGDEAGDERKYLFMGSWDPSLHRTTDSGLRVAIQMPCNVVVQESGSSALVATLDPEEAIDPADEEASNAAGEARDALQRVLKKVTEAV